MKYLTCLIIWKHIYGIFKECYDVRISWSSLKVKVQMHLELKETWTNYINNTPFRQETNKCIWEEKISEILIVKGKNSQKSNSCAVEDGKLDQSLWQDHTPKKKKIQLGGKELQSKKEKNTKPIILSPMEYTKGFMCNNIMCTIVFVSKILNQNPWHLLPE